MLEFHRHPLLEEYVNIENGHCKLRDKQRDLSNTQIYPSQSLSTIIVHAYIPMCFALMHTLKGGWGSLLVWLKRLHPNMAFANSPG